MIRTQKHEAPAAVPNRGLRESIAALARGASIETSTKNLAEVDTYASLLPAGTDVFATWIPGTPWHHIVSVATRLRLAGMNPVPHIAARVLTDPVTAAEFLARLRDEARVTLALVIGGDSELIGPYASSLMLIESGILQAHGIRSIGIAGYPEGHSCIGAAALMAALDAKIAYARRHDIELFIVSQFCFDGQAVVDWLQQLRARGVLLPVRVGVAGPTTVRKLMNYALRCGIGNSIRKLGSHAISLTYLIGQHGPEKVVRRVAASEAGLNISGLHCFPFGGFAQTAYWIDNVAAGRFQLDEADESFRLES